MFQRFFIFWILLLCLNTLNCDKDINNEEFGEYNQDNEFFVDLFSYKCKYQFENLFNLCCNDIANNIKEYIPIWHKFLCVVSSKTSYLIYYPQPIINEQSFEPFMKSVELIEDQIFSPISKLSQNYEGNLLFLPGKSINGICTQSEELVLNVESIFKSCDVDLTDANWCGQKSPMNAINYILPVDLINSTFSIIFNNEYLNITKSEINYYCCQKKFLMSIINKEEEKMKNCLKCSLGLDIKSYITKQIEGDKTCLNSVFSVKYTFFYYNINNLSLHADIYLLNVSKSDEFLNLQIMINLKNFFLGSLKQSMNENFNGYLKNSPLVFNSHNDGANDGIELWKAGDDQQCLIDQFFPIKFGINAISGCLIKISKNEFKNCQNLRSKIINMQRNILRANYVGKTPIADKYVSDDWVPVNKHEIDVSIIKQSFNMENITFDKLLDIKMCSNIPNHIFIQIFYEKISTKPKTYRILRVDAIFSCSTFEINYNMINNYNNETSFQYFLTSNISFTYFSPHKQQISRYEEFHSCKSDNCYENMFGQYWFFFLLILCIILLTNLLLVF